jgi:DNA-binding winged helix-turn-helix (wHTH) protein
MRFADCTVDFSTRQLERQGSVVPLEPKMFELLEVLIERRPAIVTNEELDELLWPKAYVARTSLTRLISKLRSAVGDTSQGSTVIRTVYKRGYAFCAAVTGVQPAKTAPATIELRWGKQSLPLTEGDHLAGRDEACALVIDAETVSRRHARITVTAGIARIEDLDSTNGTHVNGTRIKQPTTLRAGDEVLIGRESLRVKRHLDSALTVKVEDGRVGGSRAST